MICDTPTRASGLVAGLDCRLSAVCSVTPRQPRRHAMLTWITIHCGVPRRLLAEALRRRWKAGAQSSRSGVAPRLIVDVAIHVALPPKADMCGATRDVRFGPKADIPPPTRDVVGTRMQRGWNVDPQRPRRLEVKDEFEPRRVEYGKVSRVSTLKYPTRIDPALTVGVRNVCAVAHQASSVRELTKRVNRWNFLLRNK